MSALHMALDQLSSLAKLSVPFSQLVAWIYTVSVDEEL